MIINRILHGWVHCSGQVNLIVVTFCFPKGSYLHIWTVLFVPALHRKEKQADISWKSLLKLKDNEKVWHPAYTTGITGVSGQQIALVELEFNNLVARKGVCTLQPLILYFKMFCFPQVTEGFRVRALPALSYREEFMEIKVSKAKGNWINICISLLFSSPQINTLHWNITFKFFRIYELTLAILHPQRLQQFFKIQENKATRWLLYQWWGYEAFSDAD